MTDKKLTDNEIVKGLECCVKSLSSDSCNECPLNTTKECDKDSLAIEKYALDLINRLQAQNKDLAETVHNLTLEKDALFDKAEELKVEVERLNGK